MKKILVISPDIIGKKMAGPGIRYWNFAEQLGKNFQVTLIVPNEWIQEKNLNFVVEQLDSGKLEMLAKAHDAIVLQGVTLFKFPFLKKAQVPVIVDIYDPFILENFELRKHLPIKEQIGYHESDLNIILEQLAYGDYFICASEKQKDYWLGMLSALNRINPITYQISSSMEKLIGVVPFGLPSNEPVKSKQVLKGVYPGIQENDKVILWGGGIWNWFDPITLIKAIYEISKERTDIKLFFMGVKHPNPMLKEMEIAIQAAKLSEELGLTNKYVFFNYDWVDYNERQNYLLEADIGVSTHFKHLETRFSFRTRILDYLWCELPMVVTEGDCMAEFIHKNNIGCIVEEKNIEQLKLAILKMIETKEYQEYKENIKKVRNKFYWEQVTEPLVKFCEEPKISTDKKNVNILYKDNTLGNKFNYYKIRLKHHLLKKFLKQ